MFGGGFPFGEEFMGGGGGFPGQRREQKPVDNSKYYELIGVEKTATQEEIKKAFRNKARREHPDKGGDPEKFKEVTVAYEVLGDPEKRKIYDAHGQEGLERGGGGGGQGDLFDMMFGGRGGGGRPQQKPKVKPIARQIEVTLEQMFQGKEFKFNIERQRLCSGCNGVGGSDASAVRACDGCKGRGVQRVMVQLGPGMYSQSQRECEDCNGQGEMIDAKKRCKQCMGKKVAKDNKQMTVDLEKGMTHGEKVTLHGQGHEVPETEAGDLLVQFVLKKHPQFTRKGADLYMKKTVTLLEALTGARFSFKHLDGKSVTVETKKGEVIKNDSQLTAEGLGMPFYKRSYQNGNLFIQFTVKFPDSLPVDSVKTLGAALGGMGKVKSEEQVDETTTAVHLEKFSEAQKNTHAQGGTRGDSDEEEGESDEDGEGQRVGCQQQ